MRSVCPLETLGENKILSNSFCGVHALNNHELLLVPDCTSTYQGLCKFDTRSKEWTNWFAYPDKGYVKYHSSALNEGKTKLYIYGESGYVIMVDLATGEFTESDYEFHDGSYCGSFFANGYYHIIGGWNDSNKAHYEWNEEENDLKEIHKFHEDMEDVESLITIKSLYMKSRNSVILISSDAKIYEYHLSTQKCNPSNIKTKSDKMSIYSAVRTSDEKYMIMIFIAEQSIQSPVVIRVINMETGLMMKKCIIMNEIQHKMQLEIMTGDQKSEYLTIGFSREYSTAIPIDILRVISQFVIMDVLYGFDTNTAKMYRMNVDEIIQACS